MRRTPDGEGPEEALRAAPGHPVLLTLFTRELRGSNQVAEGGAPVSARGGGAVSAAQKPTVRWLPSQNGFLADFPQRHKAMLSLPGGMVNSFP